MNTTNNVQEEINRKMRWKIAEWLIEETLPEVNKISPLVPEKQTIYSKYIKRMIDIIVSLFALIITAPINIILAIITLFDVGHPIFFKQKRVGRNGELFTIIKFRNMRDTRDENGELLPPNQRVTKIGKFVRKTSLDELLNFWSILKGDMSLIGPRPMLPEHYRRFSNRHKQRFDVRPGLECPPRHLSDKPWTRQDQFENDIWYVSHVSFKTDCMMFINLIKFAFDKKSTEARANSQRGIFMGYNKEGKAIIMDEVPEEYLTRVIEYYKNKGE